MLTRKSFFKVACPSFFAGLIVSFVCVHYMSPELLANILIISALCFAVCIGVFAFFCLWGFIMVDSQDRTIKKILNR